MVAAAEEVQVVAPEQHQLHGDGGARRAAVHGAQRRGDAAQLLAAGPQHRPQRATTEKPYAIAIPEKQDDRRRLAAARQPPARARRSRSRGRATPFKVKEGDFPAGTFLVRMDQPYRGFALDLLTPQKYPGGQGALRRLRRRGLGAAREPRRGGQADRGRGGTAGAADAGHRARAPTRARSRATAPVYLLRDTGQEALLAARVRLARFKVEAAEKPFGSGGQDYPRGLLDHRRPARAARRPRRRRRRARPRLRPGRAAPPT